MPKRMLSPNAPAAKRLFNFSALWLYCSEHSVLQKCKQYILKWDAVGSILKQTKRKHQLTIKTCIKYVNKKSPVMRPNLQPKIYKSPVVA